MAARLWYVILFFSAAAWWVSDVQAFGDNTVDFDWSNWYTWEHGGKPTVNPGRYPITGMQCSNKYCGKMKVQKVKTMTDGKSKVLYVTKTAEPSTTIKVSTAQSRGKCPEGLVVIDSFCEGKHCDYSVLKCAEPIGFFPMKIGKLTPWFSSTSNSLTYCPRGYAMVGIWCSATGPYCEHKKLECAKLIAERVDYTRKMRTRWQKVCEYGPGLSCNAKIKKSITRTKGSSWSRGYSTSVGIVAGLSVEFLGSGASVESSLSSSASKEVSGLASMQKNYEVECSVTTGGTPATESMTMWQYIATAYEYEFWYSDNTLRMPICSFVITPSYMEPKCAEGKCTGQYCQQCRN